MATPRQIAANRRNALKSTGPRTAEGKLRSSQNGLKHGLCATHIVLPFEDEKEFEELRQALRDEYKPEGIREALYVDQIARHWWRLQRSSRVETALLHNRMTTVAQAEKIGDAEIDDWDAGVSTLYSHFHRDLDTHRRYETAIQNALHKAETALAHLQSARKRVEAPPKPVRSQQLHTIGFAPHAAANTLVSERDTSAGRSAAAQGEQPSPAKNPTVTRETASLLRV